MSTEWYEKYLDFGQIFIAGSLLLFYIAGLGVFAYIFIGY